MTDSALARPWVPAAGAALAVATFGIDLAVPVGYGGGMPYVIPLLLGLWGSQRYVVACTAVSIALTALGFLLSSGDHWMWTAWLNRVGALLVLGVTGAGVSRYLRAQARLDAASAELVRAHAARALLVDQLEQKNAELERFTYTVSHDLKSPLITIKGFAGTLERDARAGHLDQLAQDVGRIERAADRMKELLDDLLELSRVGRVANPSVRVPVAELVAEARELLAGILAARGVEVAVAGDLPVVHGDRVRLREVVQNLLDNAVKFMGDQPAPRIEVGAREDAARTLYVRDNGMGIDAPYLEKVFGLFERLDGSGPGTGIGLALVRRIVEVHGGRVWAESEGPGHGTTFCVTLPLADCAAGAEGAEGAAAAEAREATQ